MLNLGVIQADPPCRSRPWARAGSLRAAEPCGGAAFPGERPVSRAGRRAGPAGGLDSGSRGWSVAFLGPVFLGMENGQGRHRPDPLPLEAEPGFEGCWPQFLQLALCITVSFPLSQGHGVPVEPTASRDRPAPSGTPASLSILLGPRGRGVRAWS